MTDMTKQTEAISTERALKLALEAQIHKAGMNPVMQGECYLMHPEALQKLIEVAIREALASEAKEQPAPATELREQEPEYTWPTVAEYECDVGFKTNDAFRMGWDMARTTNKMLGITSPPAQRTWVGLTEEETGHWAADFLDGAKWAEAKLKEKNT